MEWFWSSSETADGLLYVTIWLIIYPIVYDDLDLLLLGKSVSDKKGSADGHNG